MILHDGVDTDSFKGYEKKLRKIKKITYTGSFYKGRGINRVIQLSKELPSFNFFLYGRRDENFSDIPKNLSCLGLLSGAKVLGKVDNVPLPVVETVISCVLKVIFGIVILSI